MNFLNKEFDIKNLFIKQDKASGLIAMIAIHNTKNGPALGGCRFVHYANIDDAVNDVIRLAKAMTYKSAISGLPLGGGKSVIISHPGISDRQTLFEQFGEFVESLRGEYITASDSGTSEADMKIVATKTNYVTSINKRSDLTDDTAFMTATGVIRAMEAAVLYKLGKESLNGLHVAIQGVGSVGYLITKMLLERNARVTITDKNQTLVNRYQNELAIHAVNINDISELSCDVFAPCALGGILNSSVISKIKAPIVCGAANNQLEAFEDGDELFKRNILFIPDYVANAGGVICAAAQAGVISKEDSYSKVTGIYDSVMKIIDLSNKEKQPTHKIANSLAEQYFS